jgi:flagellin-like protein
LAVEVKSLLNKILKSKKGISPILATLLLIVIAVAAVIVTYAWVMTFTTTQTTTAGKMIKFDSAVINATSDVVTVYVRNSGTEVVTVDKIYIDGVGYTSGVTGLPATINTSGTATVTLNGTTAGLDFVGGSTYKVKITGPGVFWEESVKAT